MFKVVAVIFIGILAGIGLFTLARKLIRWRCFCSSLAPSWTTAERERWTDRGYRVAQHRPQGEEFRLSFPLQQRSQRDRGEDEAGRAERVGSDQGERHTFSGGDTAQHHRQHCRAQQSQSSVQHSLHTGNGSTRRLTRLAWFLRARRVHTRTVRRCVHVCALPPGGAIGL